ncbi:glycosyltransferase [Flavobacterium sp.]|uniref:glycosyltransferase n=1 Tax=Flavobacterium sp. TaxID=239 RepID=UPI0038FD06BC
MKLSICMITYNHQDYIKQAIDSVLMQKTNFDYELVIANDNSPDETNEIINNYIDSHPDGHKIKYLHNKVNIGMMPNFINALKNCSGKYIALCEGDDYWIDEFKLQKQVDFLENNSDYVICFHHAGINTNGLEVEDTITFSTKQTTTIDDLAKGNFMHTCTVVYKNNLFNEFPDYFYKSPIGDYFLHMLNSLYGKIYCINEKMAVYRVHDTSYWSSKKQEERTAIWINFIQNMKNNFPKRIQKKLEYQIVKLESDSVIKAKKISITKKIKLKIKNIFTRKK